MKGTPKLKAPGSGGPNPDLSEDETSVLGLKVV